MIAEAGKAYVFAKPQRLHLSFEVGTLFAVTDDDEVRLRLLGSEGLSPLSKGCDQMISVLACLQLGSKEDDRAALLKPELLTKLFASCRVR